MKTFRTTVTLDADVYRRLEQAWRRSGKSRKQTLNELLRRALEPTPAAAARPAGIRRLHFGGLRAEYTEEMSASELMARADALGAAARERE